MALGDGIRRNLATVSTEERNLFIDAIKQLNQVFSSGSRNVFPAGHVSKWFKQDEIHQATHVHGQNHFFPWHRELCNRFEAMLREIHPELSLHYWDWNTDPTHIPDGLGGFINLFTPDFMGTARPEAGNLNGEAGEPWLSAGFYLPNPADDNYRDEIIHGLNQPNPADPTTWSYALHANPADPPQNLTRNVQNGVPPVGGTWQGEHWSTDAEIIDAPDFQALNDRMQGSFGDAHGLAHGWIGGTIQDAHTSFRDPFVFLLHSNLDRLWAMWQRRLPSVRLDPDHVYDPLNSDTDLNSPLQPWAGTGDWPTRPWYVPENEQLSKTSKDLSVVIPPSYDTAPHSSYIIVNRDTFSTYEVDVTTSYPEAFYVVYDGFQPQELPTPPVPVLTLNSPSGAVTTRITATPNGGAQLEDPGGAPDVPQRITYAFDITFLDQSNFPAAAADTQIVNVRAAAAGQIADARLNLIRQPNPYMVDIAAGGTNPVWLSTDTRVFQIRRNGVIGGVTHGDADVDGNAPFTFIQSVLANFNDPMMFPNDNSHPFHTQLSENEETSKLELSRSVGTERVYNYAIAKVRYKAASQPATQVKVFFRLFSTLVSALDYNTNTNYRRNPTTGADLNAIPLLGTIPVAGGTEIASIPFFAEARHADMTTQPDSTNRHDIVAGGATEQVWYFGCWLDLNQTDLLFPLNPGLATGPFTGTLKSIQQLVRGTHQCMVAEIYFWPTGTVNDPIPLGATPGSSNRLAQRNIAYEESGNPGWPETHAIQHTFMLKPSPRSEKGNFTNDAGAVGIGGAVDELMIRWNNVPRDTRVSFYLPEVEADQILALAALRQSPARLQKIDAHTFQCRVADITYIPLPGGRTGYLAGLMSLTMPAGVRTGQVYRLNVQQCSGSHKILGAFQITIPVKTDPEILPTEVRKLSVLRYIHESIPADNRWYPIFVRYLDEIARKVRGLGGDPDAVKPSPDGSGELRPQSARFCCYVAWLVALLLGVFVAALGFAGAGPPIRVFLGLLFLLALVIWLYRCKPRLCASLPPLLLGVGLGAGIVGLLVLGSLATPYAPMLLAGLAVAMAVIVLIGVVGRCLPVCGNDK